MSKSLVPFFICTLFKAPWVISAYHPSTAIRTDVLFYQFMYLFSHPINCLRVFQSLDDCPLGFELERSRPMKLSSFSPFLLRHVPAFYFYIFKLRVTSKAPLFYLLQFIPFLSFQSVVDNRLIADYSSLLFLV